MKGHMQDGKFHPHTDYKKGIRKSRDQKVKTKGVKLHLDKHNEGIRLKRSKFKSQLTPEARELFVEEVQDQISDDVNTEVASMPKAYGLTQKDVDSSTDKFNMTIIKEIDRRIEEQIQEQTEMKPMGSFEDEFKRAFQQAQTRKKRVEDAEFVEIKNKKEFIEPLVRNILTKSDDGRDIILARNYALDFSSPYLYFGVTDSGNVKLGEITQFAFKGEPEEIRNLIAKPRLDRANDTLKISIDGSTFSATIGQNNLSDLLARNKAIGNVK